MAQIHNIACENCHICTYFFPKQTADGTFILNSSMQNLPKTYSGLARRVLVKCLNLINICLCPSIKDVKRKDCGDIEIKHEFCVGPCLKITSNFNELLQIPNFKSRSLDFPLVFCDRRKKVLLLCWQWVQKILFCAWFFEIQNNSRIIWGSHWRQYRSNISCKTWRCKSLVSIIIWGNGTDIFIILLENVQKLLQSHLFTGLDSDNSCNYVDMSKLSKELQFVKVLPGIYAYTGIDYPNAFCRKRKVRSLLLMTKNPNHLWMHLCVYICGQLRSIRNYHLWYWRIYLPHVWLPKE